MSKIDPKRVVSLDSPSMRRILAVMDAADGPLDGHEIADRSHIAFNTFQNSYRHMLLEANLIHVAEYRHNCRGPFVPAYLPGPAPKIPVIKPAKIDQLVRSRNWKESTGYNEARKAGRRLARAQKNPMAYLMGIRT